MTEREGRLLLGAVALPDLDTRDRFSAALFRVVTIAEAIQGELSAPRATAAVRIWMANPPTWVSALPAPATTYHSTRALDDGERATIALAETVRADAILMDDRAGVSVARARGFAATGTLGLLHRPARLGWVDLAAAFDALTATNFHINRALLNALLAESKGWQ